MNKDSKNIQPLKQLHLIYPDIQGQLCSRHSTLFGKLKTSFNKLYDNMQPQYYIITKGNCQFIQECFAQLKLSLALENGIIILTSKTYLNSQIFINGNHFGQEVIFSPLGTLQQGLHSFGQEMQTIVKDVIGSISKDRQYGGIMYVHANIPENCFNYKQTFLISFYLSILTINDYLNVYSVNQLIEKMANLKILGSSESIQRQFLGYKNHKFNLTLPDTKSIKEIQVKYIQTVNSPEQQQKDKIEIEQQKSFCKLIQKSQLLLNMDKKSKLLFCRLDLAKEDVNYEFRRKKQILNRKNQLLKQLSNDVKISGLFQLFHNINQVNLKQVNFISEFNKQSQPRSLTQLDFQQNQDQQILQDPQKFLSVLIQQIGLVSQFSNQNISLEQLVNGVWEINSKYLRLHAKQVVQLVQSMKQNLGINGCMVVNQNFLMIVVQKHNFAELLCDIKHKMNKGELKSKSLFKIIEQEQLIQQRWSSDNEIGQKMFTSVPSLGIGIFDPSESIWFD